MGAGASTGGDGKPPQLTRANTAALVVAAGEASEEDIAAALKELPEETIKKVQAALAASPSILRVTDLITGDAQADHAKYYKLILTALATCSAEDWTRLATVPVGKYAVDIGTR